LAVMKPL